MSTRIMTGAIIRTPEDENIQAQIVKAEIERQKAMDSAEFEAFMNHIVSQSERMLFVKQRRDAELARKLNAQKKRRRVNRAALALWEAKRGLDVGVATVFAALQKAGIVRLRRVKGDEYRRTILTRKTQHALVSAAYLAVTVLYLYGVWKLYVFFQG